MTPTAVQEAGEVHDTAFSEGPLEGVGLGEGWMAQAFPSHTSARVALCSAPVK